MNAFTLIHVELGRTWRLHSKTASQLFQRLALSLVDAFVLDVLGLGH
jgi:hypothetical protein